MAELPLLAACALMCFVHELSSSHKLPVFCLQICPSSGLPCDCGKPSTTSEVFVMGGAAAGKGGKDLGPRPGTAEPIFPPELKARVVMELCMPGGWKVARD